MNQSVKEFLSFIVLTLVIFAFAGCGGGSAGTGTTTFTGKLLTTDDQPVEGAIVRVVGSDDVATTDEQGQFVISTPDQNVPHQIQVQAGGVDASVVVPAATTEESKIGVQLELDTDNATVSINSVEVKIAVIGECEKYFVQQGETVVQVKPVPDMSKCTVQVAANNGSRPVGGIQANVQRNTCTGAVDEEANWINVASGRTKESGSRGRVDIKFTFLDDDAHCRYRVVAPFGDANRTALFFPIVTLREQNKP